MNAITFAAALSCLLINCLFANQRPNVIVIYTDDHRFTGVHALGGQPVQTPHMDQLAEDGISFTRAYLMGAFTGATCVPSRASLLTGRDVFKLHHTGHVIPPEHTTIGQSFQRAGYRTHIVGKWHQDRGSLARSFDSGSTIMSIGGYLVDHFRMPLLDWDPTGKFSRKDAYLLTYDEKQNIVRRPVNSEDKRGPTGTEANGPHTSEIFADNAIQVIEKHDSTKPLFMYLAFHAPHDPRQAPKKYREMYPPEDIQLPPSYASQHPFDNGHLVLRDEKLAPWPRIPEIARQELADYYAIITHLDAQIGRVVDSIKNSKHANNTLIVLAGDSGLAVGCHGLLGKQNVYDEDGIHVPFIIAGAPVKEKGRTIDSLCYIHDIFPTVCDLASIPAPTSANGRSLLPVIEKKTTSIRDHTYHAYMQFQRAYRKGDYKLIEYVRADGSNKRDGDFTRGSRVTQLFNYKNDRWETLNLAVFPEYQERLESMRQEMRQTAKDHGDNKAQTGQAFDFWEHY